MIEVLLNAIVVVILQYINESNHHIHLKLTQGCMTIISQYFVYFKKKAVLQVVVIASPKSETRRLLGNFSPLNL